MTTHYKSIRDRQIKDKKIRVVGQTRSGLVFHIATRGYDASTFPHPGPTEYRAACRGDFLLTVNMQKYVDLVAKVPKYRIQWCSSCFGVLHE